LSCLLTPLWIGIVYQDRRRLVVAQNITRTTTTDLSRNEDGSVLVAIVGNDPKALKAFRSFAEKEFAAEVK
jgi:hypothetical protein